MNNESKKSYTYEYPRPAMTADCVIFGFDGEQLKILLIERGIEPFKGYWALPGGFMQMNETIEQCAIRELLEETGISDVYLEQFRVYSDVMRDPRGRVVTVAFIALVRPSEYTVFGGDDAARAFWFNARQLPPLAFDHRMIVADALSYLREILKLRPVAFRLLDDVFTVDEIRKVYEVINDTQYDRRNFQRKLMQSEILEDRSEIPEGSSRPQRLFSLRSDIAFEQNEAPEAEEDTNCFVTCSERDVSITESYCKDDDWDMNIEECITSIQKNRTLNHPDNSSKESGEKKNKSEKRSRGIGGSLKDLFNF